MTPVHIKRLAEGLTIEWNDGTQTTTSVEELRRSCPCATCAESRGEINHERPLQKGRKMLQVVKSTAETSLELKQIWPVGNYALGVRWGDGHASGIYSFVLLRELAEKLNQEECAKASQGSHRN